MNSRMQVPTTPVHYPLTGQYHQSSVTSHQVTQYPSQQISAATPSYQASMAGYQYGGATTMSNAMSHGSASVTRGTPAGPERVQSTRKISSTIVNEQIMGPPPQDFPVREIEVPGQTEEKITKVPRREVREIEKIVTVPKIEYVDKIIPVPKVVYVDKTIEVPQYQEVPVPNKVIQWVDVPKEVIKEVKVPKINYVDKIVEVPGEIIKVPKPYQVQQNVLLTQYNDRSRPVIVAQAVRPVIVEGAGVTEVDVYEYEPECVPVDVHVVKGVQAQVQVGGVIETTHKVVSVPSAQYNTVLEQLNVHLDKVEKQKLPYRTENGQITFLGEYFYTAEVQPGVEVSGLDLSNLEKKYVDYNSRQVMPIDDPRAMAMGFGGGAQYSGGATTTTTMTTNSAYGPMVNVGATNVAGSTVTGGYGTTTKGLVTGLEGVSGMTTGGMTTGGMATSGMQYTGGSYGATSREYTTRSTQQQQTGRGYSTSSTLLVPSNTLMNQSGYNMQQNTMRTGYVA